MRVFSRELQLWPRPRFSVFLLLLWLLLVNSASPGQILIGAVLGWFIPFGTQQLWQDRHPIKSIPKFMLYLGRLIKDIVTSNFVVAWLILCDPKKLQPAFIRFPVSLTDDVALTLLASSISLTPGTVSSGLSPDGRTLLIHMLHVTDEEAVIRQIRERYEQPLKELFE